MNRTNKHKHEAHSRVLTADAGSKEQPGESAGDEQTGEVVANLHRAGMRHAVDFEDQHGYEGCQ